MEHSIEIPVIYLQALALIGDKKAVNPLYDSVIFDGKNGLIVATQGQVLCAIKHDLPNDVRIAIRMPTIQAALKLVDKSQETITLDTQGSMIGLVNFAGSVIAGESIPNLVQALPEHNRLEYYQQYSPERGMFFSAINAKFLELWFKVQRKLGAKEAYFLPEYIPSRLANSKHQSWVFHRDCVTMVIMPFKTKPTTPIDAAQLYEHDKTFLGYKGQTKW